MRPLLLPVLLLAAASGCARTAPERPTRPPLPGPVVLQPAEDPAFRSDASAVLIRGATVMTAAGVIHSPGHVLMREGVLAAVGAGEIETGDDVTIIDAQGLYVTPGIIDTHSHMGVYAYPQARAHEDGNEMSSPNTAEVWAEHGLWPQDPAIPRALAGGVTTAQILPGSGNLIGGRGVTIRLRPATSARQMRFPGAPQGLKLACGENPKRAYGDRRSAPMTRMGNVAGHRAAFQRALEYRRRWSKHERDLAEWRRRGGADGGDDPPDPPERNFNLESLAAVLDGRILVHWHCYRADELHQMLDLAREYGFTIRSFHHAVEAYKLAGRLADEGVGISTWSDWWGFKMEAFDGVPQNAALLTRAGARAIIHSDSPVEIRRLNQEAAKARAAGLRMGIEVSEDEALRWLTANPAWALGIDEQVGTLEVGKRADVVLWDRSPFSVYARPAQVYIDGERVFDRLEPLRPTDFELGLAPPEEDSR